MRISLQVVVQNDGEVPATVTEIAQFERKGFDAGSLGLHLEEAKSLLGQLQRTMVAAQVAEAVARTSVCPTCGAPLACKGHHRLVFRSPFGRMSIDSPRLYPCRQCTGNAPAFSPVASGLLERVSPELQYLEVKFAALMSYGLTVNVLQEVLPLDHVLAASSMRDQDAGHSFAYVHKLEQRPVDRMLNFRWREGVQPAQPVTFLSDGGETVRSAQFGFGDRGECVLDWFHIAMRVQNLEQMIKGRPSHSDGPSNATLIKALRGAKWHLWHGCPYPRSGARSPSSAAGWKLNRPPIPGSRWRWRRAFVLPTSRNPVRCARSALTAATLRLAGHRRRQDGWFEVIVGKSSVAPTEKPRLGS